MNRWTDIIPCLPYDHTGNRPSAASPWMWWLAPTQQRPLLLHNKLHLQSHLTSQQSMERYWMSIWQGWSYGITVEITEWQHNRIIITMTGWQCLFLHNGCSDVCMFCNLSSQHWEIGEMRVVLCGGGEGGGGKRTNELYISIGEENVELILVLDLHIND